MSANQMSELLAKGLAADHARFSAWQEEKAPAPEQDDALSLLGFVLDSRRHVFAFAAAGLLASVAIGALWVLRAPSVTTYKSAASLSMKSAGPGYYPNGSVFSPLDIRSPAVLQLAYKQQNLADFGLSFQDFSNAVNVGMYAPQIGAITERYRPLLAAKDLTPEERRLRSDEYYAEISSAGKSGIYVSLAADSRFRLSDEMGLKVTDSILLAWSNVYIGTLGVASLPIPASAANLVKPDFVKNADVPVAYDYLDDALKELFSRIDDLSQLPGVSSVVPAESGMSLYDIRREAENLRAFEMELILAPIAASGLSNEAPITA